MTSNDMPVALITGATGVIGQPMATAVVLGTLVVLEAVCIWKLLRLEDKTAMAPAATAVRIYDDISPPVETGR